MLQINDDEWLWWSFHPFLSLCVSHCNLPKFQLSALFCWIVVSQLQVATAVTEVLSSNLFCLQVLWAVGGGCVGLKGNTSLHPHTYKSRQLMVCRCGATLSVTFVSLTEPAEIVKVWQFSCSQYQEFSVSLLFYSFSQTEASNMVVLTLFSVTDPLTMWLKLWTPFKRNKHNFAYNSYNVHYNWD